jgi:hypothetical protein
VFKGTSILKLHPFANAAVRAIRHEELEKVPKRSDAWPSKGDRQDTCFELPVDEKGWRQTAA